MGLVQVVPHGDGGGPVILLGTDQGLAQEVNILVVLLSLSGETGNFVCKVTSSLSCLSNSGEAVSGLWNGARMSQDQPDPYQS